MQKNAAPAYTAVLIIFAILLAAAGCSEPAGSKASASQPSVPRKGEPAPDFTLKSLEGETVTLSQFRGKSNVLIHFGTTWCPPCRTQAPRLNELHKEHGGEGLVVLSVDSGEPPDIVRRFVDEEGAEYKTLLDSDNSVAIRYAIEYIPLNVLVDKSGNIYVTPSNPIPERAIAELLEGGDG